MTSRNICLKSIYVIQLISKSAKTTLSDRKTRIKTSLLQVNIYLILMKDSNKKYLGLAKEELLAKRREVQKEIDALEAEVFDGKYSKVTKHCFVTFNTRKGIK